MTSHGNVFADVIVWITSGQSVLRTGSLCGGHRDVPPLRMRSWTEACWGDRLFMRRGDCLFTHRGNHLFTGRGNRLFMPRGDCLFTGRGDHLFTGRRHSPFHTNVKADCWSSLRQLSIPPQDQQRWSPFHAQRRSPHGWVSIDPPLQIFDSLIFNIRIF